LQPEIVTKYFPRSTRAADEADGLEAASAARTNATGARTSPISAAVPRDIICVIEIASSLFSESPAILTVAPGIS
jgi:hypothetical protein